MRSCSMQTAKAGLKVGPASLSSLVVVLLLASAALAQNNKQIRAINSLLGVSIGATFEEARAKLTPLGTGGGRDTRDGGRKEAWTLKGTEYATLAFKTNGRGTVVWVSAFARPGKEVPFSKLGDLSKAAASDSQAIWTIETPKVVIVWLLRAQRGKPALYTCLRLNFLQRSD